MFSLKIAFYFLIRENRKVLNLMKDIERSHYIYMMGGAVRNYIENDYKFSIENMPKDFDFVIDYKKGKSLREILSNRQIRYSRNRFGGYKIQIKEIKIDIWELKETWAFKNSSMVANYANLENSVFLNVDGIVYDFYRDAYYKKAYDEAERSRKISIVFRQEPYENINAVRAISYARRYKMKYSNQVNKMIEKYMSGRTVISGSDNVAGGDFTKYNRRFDDLEADYRKLPIVPVAVEKSEIVSDSARTQLHQASKKLHYNAVEKYDKFVRDATSLRNDINDHLDELQNNSKGGHLENWQEKISKIEEWIGECKSKRESDEQYL